MKKIIWVIFIFLLGVTFTYAAELVLSKDVTYDNTSSNLNATNVQDAIDELYALKIGDSTKYEILQNWKKITVKNKQSTNYIYTAPDNYYEYTTILIFFYNSQADRQIYAGIATNCTSSVNQYSTVQAAVITLTDFTDKPTYQFQMYGSNSPYIIVYGIK